MGFFWTTKNVIDKSFLISKLNCEVLHEDNAFEVRWSVVESGETIVFQLVGKIDQGQYMGFGLSGEDDRSAMVGGDAMIGWVDQTTGRGNVIDYHLSSKSTCKGDSGSCPDIRLGGTNNLRLLNAAVVDGFTILTYQRKLRTPDFYDKSIRTNETQPVIWAIGKIENDLAGYHNIRTKDDFSIDFGRIPKWNCPEPEQEPEISDTLPKQFAIPTKESNPVGQASAVISHKEVLPAGFPKGHPQAASGTSYLNPSAWKIPPIPCYEPEDRVFYVQIGPSGRKEVFRALTGKNEFPTNVWYINGLLMPEISLVRHKNYTFVIQGGDNNPFYITSSPEGGPSSEQKNFKSYAGIQNDIHGKRYATASGKLCHWTESGNQPADSFPSYAAYQRSLSLDCKKGTSGVLQFTPDEQTPNLLYYQSYYREHLGWKIHIVDGCRNGDKLSNDHVNPIVEKKHPIQAQTNHQFLQNAPQAVLDQHIGESVKRDSVIAFSLPNGVQQQHQNIFIRTETAPIKSMEQGSYPILEDGYLFDPSGVSGAAGKVPNIAPLDGSRLIFNGKSVESVTQGPNVNTRQGQIIPMPPGGTFQFSSNPGVYQIAIDPTGENGSQAPQSVYASSAFQAPMQGDGQFLLKRTGSPQQTIQSPYKVTKFGRPEVSYESYIGSNREPVMSHPMHYENVPHHQPIIYASTISPQRHNNIYSPQPSFVPHDRQPELQMRLSGPGPNFRVQNIPRRSPPSEIQGNMSPDNVNVKYIEYPHSGIQIIQNDGRFNSLHSWTHSRNLPKRDHLSQGPPPRFFKEGSIMKTLRRTSRNDGFHTNNSKGVSSDPEQPVNDNNSEGINSPQIQTRKPDQEKNATNQKVSTPILTENSTSPSPVDEREAVKEKESTLEAIELTKKEKCETTNAEKCSSVVEEIGEESQPHKETIQRSEDQEQKFVPQEVFQMFGPIFRPSPHDTAEELELQNHHHLSSSLLVPDSKRKFGFESTSGSLNEPRLSPAFTYSPIRIQSQTVSIPPRNIRPKFPSHFHHTQLQRVIPKPQPSSSTFHEIIKVLVPGVRSALLKYERTNRPHYSNGANYPSRRFPFQHRLYNERNNFQGMSHKVIPVLMERIGLQSQKHNDSLINNKSAQIDRKEEISGEHDENGNKETAGVVTEANEGQDSLSLTLLTDVWQIINQQGISNPTSVPQQKQQQQNLFPAQSGLPFRGKMMITPGAYEINSNSPYQDQIQQGLKEKTELKNEDGKQSDEDFWKGTRRV